MKYLLRIGQDIKVYQDNKNKWDCLFEVTKAADKVISVTGGIKVKQLNISAILSMTHKTSETELKRRNIKDDKICCRNIRCTTAHDWPTKLRSDT